MKRKPIKGETLWLLNVGNMARRQVQTLTPCIVTKVGSKYFEVEGERLHGTNQFYIGTWCEKTNYQADWAIYESEQEWMDERENGVLIQLIRDSFSIFNQKRFTLPTLRKIAEIIKEDAK